MFEKKSRFNYALVFNMPNYSKILNSIHMLFVFFDICAIFLDKDKKVVDKVILKSFSLTYTPKKRCKYIIELPQKYEKEFKIGQEVNWRQ